MSLWHYGLNYRGLYLDPHDAQPEMMVIYEYDHFRLIVV